MKTFIDQIGRTVRMPSFPPKRIISLAPAITETMYYLELSDQIVGRTRFCLHPDPEVKKAMNVGGTKDMKLDRIQALDPHLIIAEKEENTKEMVEELQQHFPVYVFEIQTIEAALKMIKDLGTITNRSRQANKCILTIKKAFTPIQGMIGARFAYIIWQNPLMVVGGNTYINDVFKHLGFSNPFENHQGRYPEITEAQLKEADLDYLFLATEPFPFGEKERKSYQAIFPEVSVRIIDGEMLWYGARMIKAAQYFKNNLVKL